MWDAGRERVAAQLRPPPPILAHTQKKYTHTPSMSRCPWKGGHHRSKHLVSYVLVHACFKKSKVYGIPM